MTSISTKSTRVRGEFLSRRGFIKCASLAAVAAMVPLVPRAAQASLEHERTLSFNHLHTGEKLKLTYWADGQYIDESLAEINHLLRDFRTGERIAMDKDLYDLLFSLQQATGNHRSFEIISGYRSPKTNEALRSKSTGVAKKSLHMLGQAIDVRLPGTELKKLHKAAMSAKMGGVGLYTKSNFLHLDTGRVRAWGK